MNNISRSLAAVIGINTYSNGVPVLRSAVNDAMQLQAVLKRHEYDVELRTNEQATRTQLIGLFTNALPKRLAENDRLLVYFAGHGVALDGDDGPAGYILPYDAQSGDNTTFLPMHQLHQWLTSLPCHHMLLILDCCFAGAFRWSSTRHIGTRPQPLYRERYERFLASPAWQVITSASYDQQALDLVVTYGDRSDNGRHSPFAQALFLGLDGAADQPVVLGKSVGQPDGVITATDLYSYLRDQVELGAINRGQTQTPSIWPLNKHRHGEYVFLVPGQTIHLPQAPELNADNNPYRGLEPYEEQHADLFFGRDKQIAELLTAVATQPLTVVVGASGSGKSSLVKAGMVPKLREDPAQSWQLIGPIRPGRLPQQALTSALPVRASSLAKYVLSVTTAENPQPVLVIVDQFEELITICEDVIARDTFLSDLAAALSVPDARLHIVITVRADFEPQFVASALKPWWVRSRFVVPPLTQDDLRAIILGPAATRVLYFEPDTLVDRIINEVVQTPGALPLLSFTLSELYIKYLERRADNRALIEADYEQLGEVAGSLRIRATAEYEGLDELHQATMRRVLLRMVSLEGGEIARRRVPRSELIYADEDENNRVAAVLNQLTKARLIVQYKEMEGEPVVEPAHDALVRGWDMLWSWVRNEQDRLVLAQRITQATNDWQVSHKHPDLLWHDDPRLRQAQAASEQERNVVRQFWFDLTGYVPQPADWLNRAEREFVATSGRRRSRLRQRLVGILTGVSTVVMTLAVVAWLQRNAAVTQNDLRATQEALAQANAAEARTQASIAQTAEAQTREQLALANSQRLAFASQFERATRPDIALAVAYEASQLDHNSRSDQALRDLLYALPMRPTLLGQQRGVSNIVPSPDGTYLIVEPEEGQSELWDKAGRQVATFDGRSSIFSSDGKYLLTAVGENTMHVYETSGKKVAVFTGESGMFSPDTRHLLTEEYDPNTQLYRLHVWDLAGRQIAQMEGEARAFTPDSQSIIIESSETTGIRSLSGDPRATFPGVFAGIRPDGRRLATITPDGVRVWQLDGTAVAMLPGAAAVFSPDNRHILTWEDFARPKLWNEQGRQVAEYEVELDSRTSSVAFTPDGHYLLTWSEAGAGSPEQPILWCVEQTIDGPPENATCIDSSGVRQHSSPKDLLVTEQFAHRLDGKDAAISPDGKHILTWLRFGGGWLWDLNGRNVATFNEQFVEFANDGQSIIGWTNQSSEGLIWLWDAVKDPLRRFQESDENIVDARYSPDGKLILTSTRNDISHLWSITGELLALFKGGNARFSQDGQRVFTSTGSSRSSLRDHQGHMLIYLPDCHGILSPDGEHILSSSKEGEYRLHDLSGNLVATLPGSSPTFSPNGQLILLWQSHSNQQQTVIYDLSGKLRVTLDGTQPIISNDGRFILASSGGIDSEEATSLWDIDGNLRATVRGSPAAFSPDSQRFVTNQQFPSQSYLFDLSGKQLAVLTGINPSFDADGQYVSTIGYTERLVGSTYGPTYIWSKDGQAVNTIPLNGDRILFGPKDNRLLTVEYDGNLRLWSMEGQLLATIPNGGNVFDIHFSPDGSRIITTNSDGIARQNLINFQDLQAVVACRITRTLDTDAIQRLQVPTPLFFERSPPTCPPTYSWEN